MRMAKRTPTAILLIAAVSLASCFPFIEENAQSKLHNETICLTHEGEGSLKHNNGHFHGKTFHIDEAMYEEEQGTITPNHTKGFNPFRNGKSRTGSSPEEEMLRAFTGAMGDTVIPYSQDTFMHSDGQAILCCSRLGEERIMNAFFGHNARSCSARVIEVENIFPTDETARANECNFGFGNQIPSMMSTVRGNGPPRFITWNKRKVDLSPMKKLIAVDDPKDPEREYAVWELDDSERAPLAAAEVPFLNYISIPTGCSSSGNRPRPHFVRTSKVSNEVCWAGADGLKGKGYQAFPYREEANDYNNNQWERCNGVPEHKALEMPKVPFGDYSFAPAGYSTRTMSRKLNEPRVFLCGAILLIAICPQQPGSGGADLSSVNKAIRQINKDFSNVRKWEEDVSDEIRNITLAMLTLQIKTNAIEMKEGLAWKSMSAYKEAQNKICEKVMALGGTCSIHGNCVTVYRPDIDVQKIAHATSAEFQKIGEIDKETLSGKVAIGTLVVAILALIISLLCSLFVLCKGI